MTLEYENDGELHEKLITEVLAQYPDKFAKRRRKHLSVSKATDEQALAELQAKEAAKAAAL